VQSHCQEALLAYFIIWQWGSGIRKKELDISIEHFLKTKYIAFLSPSYRENREQKRD